MSLTSAQISEMFAEHITKFVAEHKVEFFFDEDDHDGDTLEITISRENWYDDEDDEFGDNMSDLAYTLLEEFSARLDDLGISSEVDSDSGDPVIKIDYRDCDFDEDGMED